MPGKKHTNLYIKHTSITLFLFFVFSFVWLWQYNGFQVIRYLEEIQLFRTDLLYFQQYLSQPAGIIQYIGAFLTQFFYLPWAGAFILSLLLVIIYLLLFLICHRKGKIERFFLLLYPVPVLLLFSCSMTFRTSFLAAIIFNLVFFLFYLYLPAKFRQAGGILLVSISWFITGGLSFLLGSLLVIHLLFSSGKPAQSILPLILCGVLLPYISYYYLYVTSWDKIGYSLTTLHESHPNKLYIGVCIAIPVIYLLWIFLSKAVEKETSKPGTRIPVYYLLLLLSLFSGFIFCTHTATEKIARMGYETEKGNWAKVLEISKHYSHRKNMHNVQKVTYFTNLALSGQGKLMEEMFCYEQLGPAGLFTGRKKDYATLLAKGEMYYRLGIIPAAEHCAFEALVVAPQEHSSKALRRLVETNALRRDTMGFGKYAGHFLNSPTYRQWAYREKEAFYQNKNHSPDKPAFAEYRDFILRYDSHESNIVELLKADPKNKKAFEYLMASLLLNKDMNSFMKLMDKYWEGMEYRQIPRYFEEAILLCRYVLHTIEEETVHSYQLPGQREIELIRYIKAVENAATEEEVQEVKKKFGSTYWYYYTYAKPLKYETEAATARY